MNQMVKDGTGKTGTQNKKEDNGAQLLDLSQMHRFKKSVLDDQNHGIGSQQYK
jgi:hypothetical protein